MDRKEIHCIVSGRVQGVTYRNFVAKHAHHLAIVGFVRNLPNFQVEVVAQGYSDSLEKLIEYIRKGPFMAQVSNVSIEWREPKEDLKTFRIEF